MKEDFSNVEEVAMQFGWKQHFEKAAKLLG